MPFDCTMGGFGSFYLDWNWKSELELFFPIFTRSATCCKVKPIDLYGQTL